MGNVVNPNKIIPNMPQKGQYKSSPNGSCCIPIGEMYLLLISNGLAMSRFEWPKRSHHLSGEHGCDAMDSHCQWDLKSGMHFSFEHVGGCLKKC